MVDESKYIQNVSIYMAIVLVGKVKGSVIEIQTLSIRGKIRDTIISRLLTVLFPVNSAVEQ